MTFFGPNFAFDDFVITKLVPFVALHLLQQGQNATFRYNSLVRFNDISGRCGLFAAVSRPFWILAERGIPLALLHRMRHLAAGSPYPTKAFCPNLGVSVVASSLS